MLEDARTNCSGETLSSFVMRATVIFCESSLFFRPTWARWAVLIGMLFMAVNLPARGDKADAESAARRLATEFEKDRYEFRADAWVRDLSPKVGKALKVQLFKGNDYRFCIAVPRDSGVFVTAAVLDLEGKPSGEIQPVLEGWGCVLTFSPKKTGVYVVAVRQTPEGKQREVPCAVLTGYR